MPVRSIEAPVGGWNARDAVDNMPPADAIELVNMVPSAGDCVSRGGYVEFCDGMGDWVRTLAEFRSGSAQKFIAAADGELWEISTGTASSLKSGLTEDRWQHSMFNSLLVMVNGADTPQVYNGSTVSDLSATGPTIANLIGLNLYKGRMYYWEDDSASFWYASAGAYAGTLTEFDLSTIAQKGGKLVQMLTWTRDAGDGMDDVAVFVFSTGEALVYQGDDPGDATAWALVGRYQLGAPLSTRSHTRFGGDEVLATTDGVISLQDELMRGRSSNRGRWSKIVNEAKKRVAAIGASQDWEVLYYPKGSWLVINVPLSATTREQHVANTNSPGWTGGEYAWCKFTGWNATCFGIYNDQLYFGGNGKVYKADFGVADDGAVIELEGTPAFQQLGRRTRQVNVGAVQPVTTFKYPTFIAVSMAADYLPFNKQPVETAPEQVGADWETSDWDEDYWAQTEGRTTLPWLSVTAHGYAVTVNMRMKSKAQRVRWRSTRIMYENAGTV